MHLPIASCWTFLYRLDLCSNICSMTDENETRFEARFHARRKRWEYRAQNRSKHGHIWTGIFIILVGVAALIKVSVEGLPAWLFSWQMFLIALGLFIGFKHKFRGSAWFVLILLGTAFMLRDMYPEVSFRPYIWPSVLVLIGILVPIRNIVINFLKITYALPHFFLFLPQWTEIRWIF